MSMKSKCLFKVSAAGYIWSVRRECVDGYVLVYVVRRNRRLVNWPWGFDNLREACDRAVWLAKDVLFEISEKGGEE